ncbi:KAP family NTPase [Pseudoalteromonas rhizosphaerae]|uniref:KAP family NTPase n=1 Tax=Pseudoalteromonas rhizosphaerae TaxID=2518973 RepID=UPI00214942BF|nr:KAP family NTPase [Pseudoalteromonas rhizosphaerae]
MKFINFSRYMSLAVYSVVTYLLFSFLTTLTTFEKLWNWWSQHLLKVFDAHNGNDNFLFSGYSILLFITGVMITKIASDFSIYHEKRPWQFNYRYPSLMLSVIFVIVFWTILNFDGGRQNPFDFLLANLWLLIGFSFLPLLHTLKNIIISRNVNTPINEHDWHSSTKHVATEIEKALSSTNSDNNSIRIAVLGKFGVGKTTAINLAVDKLKNKKGLPKFIHCNIDLWGVETESIIQYVLDEVLIALGTEVDMCKFRSLPSHYISAMNAGNTPFKIFAAFVHKPTSPDALLKNLSDVISAANLRLLITIQDLDRNQKAVDSLHALAGLLDRLEKLKGIDYIFAGENTTDFSATLLRICPIRFDFSVPNLFSEINQLEIKLLDSDTKEYYKKVLVRDDLPQCQTLIDKLLPSFRAFNTFEIQVKAVWKYLNGEVLLYDLMLLEALKGNYPYIYDVLIKLFHDTSFKSQLFVDFFESNFLESSDFEKHIVEESLRYFGFISSRVFSSDKERSGQSIEISKDLLSEHVLSFNTYPHILNSIIEGRLTNERFRQRDVFNNLNKIVLGDESAIIELCNAVKNQETSKFWLDAIKLYGWSMFYNEIRSQKTVKSLFKNAVNLNNSRASLELMVGFSPRDYSIKEDSILMAYLFSDEIIEDMFNERHAFTYGTLFALLHIYSKFSSFGRFGSSTVKYKTPMNCFVMRLVNSEDPLSVAILLNLFTVDTAEVLDLILNLSNETLNVTKILFENTDFNDVSACLNKLAERKPTMSTEGFDGIKKDALKVVERAISMK